MAESTVERLEMEALQPASVSYLVSDTLFIQTDKPFVEGEEIAQGVTVFYGKDDSNEVVGIMIDGAEGVLKPFVDTILAKRGRTTGNGDTPRDMDGTLRQPTLSATPSIAASES